MLLLLFTFMKYHLLDKIQLLAVWLAPEISTINILPCSQRNTRKQTCEKEMLLAVVLNSRSMGRFFLFRQVNKLKKAQWCAALQLRLFSNQTQVFSTTAPAGCDRELADGKIYLAISCNPITSIFCDTSKAVSKRTQHMSLYDSKGKTVYRLQINEYCPLYHTKSTIRL